MCRELDDRSYQGIYIDYESTNWYWVYNFQYCWVFVTRDVHFDEAHCYDQEHLKLQNFADNQWYKKDDEPFADVTDILDTSIPIPELNTILHKSFFSYPDKLFGSSPFSDIRDLVGDEE